MKRFDNIKIKHATFPTFSPDGAKIAFLGALDEYGKNRNIYIMNANGSEIRQITDFDFTGQGQEKGNLQTSNFAIAPSFSPDGRRIIFAKARFKRERAYPLHGTMNTAWDVYEIDLAAGVEHRLTRYDFLGMHWPHYMPGGKQFVFSAEGPVNETGKGPKNYEEYEAMYQKNFIFIMDGLTNELKPAFTYGSNSVKPCLMPDGAIIFVSEILTQDTAKSTQELFLYKNGDFKQLTQLKAWIHQATASSDGQYVMFSKESGKNTDDRSIWLMKIDGTGLREVKVPLNRLKP